MLGGKIMTTDFYNKKDREIAQLIHGINAFELVGNKLRLALKRFFEDLTVSERAHYIDQLNNVEDSVQSSLLILIEYLNNLYDSFGFEPYYEDFLLSRIDIRYQEFLDLCLQKIFQDLIKPESVKKINFIYHGDLLELNYENIPAPSAEFIYLDNKTKLISSFLNQADSETEDIDYISAKIKIINLAQKSFWQSILEKPKSSSHVFFSKNYYQDNLENRNILVSIIFDDLIGRFLNDIGFEISLTDIDELVYKPKKSEVVKRNKTQYLNIVDAIRPEAKSTFYKVINTNSLQDESKKDIVMVFKAMNRYGYFKSTLSIAELSELIKVVVRINISPSLLRKYGQKYYSDWLDTWLVNHHEIPFLLHN